MEWTPHHVAKTGWWGNKRRGGGAVFFHESQAKASQDNLGVFYLASQQFCVLLLSTMFFLTLSPLYKKKSCALASLCSTISTKRFLPPPWHDLTDRNSAQFSQATYSEPTSTSTMREHIVGVALLPKSVKNVNVSPPIHTWATLELHLVSTWVTLPPTVTSLCFFW